MFCLYKCKINNKLQPAGGGSSLRLSRVLGGGGLTCLAIAVMGMTLLDGALTNNAIIYALDNNDVPTRARTIENSPTIVLSITPLFNADSQGSYAVASLRAPSGGGIATAGHAVEVQTNAPYAVGYTTTMQVAGDSNSLVNRFNSDLEIVATTGSLEAPKQLQPNEWGVAIRTRPFGKNPPNENSCDMPHWDVLTKPYYYECDYSDYTSTNQSEMLNTRYAGVPSESSGRALRVLPIEDGTYEAAANPNRTEVYYGARVSNLTAAGEYTAGIIYTATVNPVSQAVLSSVLPNSYRIKSGSSNEIELSGQNLITTHQVFIDFNNNGKPDDSVAAGSGVVSELCGNLNVPTDKEVHCNIPTDDTIQELLVDSNGRKVNSKTFKIYVTTWAGIVEQPLDFTYYRAAPSVSPNDPGNGERITIDYDNGLIPVRYESGDWVVVTDYDLANSTDNWFNYADKRWANAVTVKADKLADYVAATGDSNRTVVNNDDVLGYWVYIPRYAYEVQRRDATDRWVSASNYDIKFETGDDLVKIPAKCNMNTAVKLEQNINSAVDYRTECGLNREYPGNDSGLADGGTTWATHPAFIWGDQTLNGIWVGKFETTGTVVLPTIRPNELSNTKQSIGEFYTAAKHIGIYDRNNTGGSPVSSDEVTLNATGSWGSLHSLGLSSSHMLKNSEWGAVVYLATSNYGTGVSGVAVNTANPARGSTDGDGDAVDTSANVGGGITGCGAGSVNGAKFANGQVTNSEACGSSDNAYNGVDGRRASTTGNEYGIYDMAGGAYEYVSANLSSSSQLSESNDGISQPAVKPYVDLYSTEDGFTSHGDSGSHPVSWSQPDKEGGWQEFYWNNDVCTWSNCGGQALHETKVVQSVNEWGQSWLSNGPHFVRQSGTWFIRGGCAGEDGTGAGLFSSFGKQSSGASGNVTYRASLMRLSD